MQVGPYFYAPKPPEQFLTEASCASYTKGLVPFSKCLAIVLERADKEVNSEALKALTKYYHTQLHTAPLHS